LRRPEDGNLANLFFSFEVYLPEIEYGVLDFPAHEQGGFCPSLLFLMVLHVMCFGLVLIAMVWPRS
jgi:hypothetical protein